MNWTILTGLATALALGLFLWTPMETDGGALQTPAGSKTTRVPKLALKRVEVRSRPLVKPFATEVDFSAPLYEVPAFGVEAKKVRVDDIPVPARVRAILEQERIERWSLASETIPSDGSPDSGGIPLPMQAGGGRGGPSGGSMAATAGQTQSEGLTLSMSMRADTRTDGPGQFSYRPYLFLPGLTQSGRRIDEVSPELVEIEGAIQGPPDYSLTSKVPMKDRLLSLGNGGVIILEVVDGTVVDGDGPDFVVFENPFSWEGRDGTKEVYVETAVVSVADFDLADRYRPFPCGDKQANYKGCAGVIPVRYSSRVPLDEVGGDLFDLKDVGLKSVRYIRIEDTGDNQSYLEGTEGFDLDAIGLIHTKRP